MAEQQRQQNGDAAQSKANASGEQIEVCSVRVGETLFGIPIANVLEILGRPATEAVPLAPAWVGGLVHYRGELLTSVSLRRLLGMEAGNGVEDVLVFESSDGHFGLLVDAVGEVLTVSSTEYEPNPSTLDERRKAIYAGAWKRQEGLLVALDAERLEPINLSRTIGA